MVKISVIMSTKDTPERYLCESIESILNQSLSNFEFLIMNDGGKNDKKIIEKYKDDRIKIFNNEKSIGLTKSLNILLKKSTGKYIARMDSDDICEKDRLKIQFDFMESHPNIDVTSVMYHIFGDSRKTMVDIFNSPKEKKAELFFYNKICHPGAMIRKSTIDKNNIFYDEKFKYSQDYDMWDRISKIGSIYVIPEICINYRVHKNQISSAKRDEQNNLCKIIHSRNLELMKLNSDEFIDFIMALCLKNNLNYDYKTIKKYSRKIIKHNHNYRIYDEKIFSRIMYYRIFIYCIRKKKYLLSIKYAMNCNLLDFIIKKYKMKIKVLKK